MATPQKSILVLGAGELGTAVLISLAGHVKRSTSHVSVLLRQSTIDTKDRIKRDQLNHLKNLGVKFLAADIDKDSKDQLAAKFASFDVIVGCTGMYSPPGTQVKLAEAVLTARVPRYIPWQFGVDYDIIGRNSSQDLFTEQMSVRDLLRGQTSTSWIIVSTGIFMSFLFEESFGVVTKDRRTVRALGSWDNAVTVTDVQDIGKIVAEIVFVEQDIACEVVYTAGNTISYRALAQAVSETEGMEANRELWTVQQLKDDLSQDPNDGMKKYRIVFAEGKGVSWDVKNTLNHRKDIPLRSVRQWLKETRS